MLTLVGYSKRKRLWLLDFIVSLEIFSCFGLKKNEQNITKLQVFITHIL